MLLLKMASSMMRSPVLMEWRYHRTNGSGSTVMFSALVSEERRVAPVFDLLDELRKRPGVYVGGDGSQRVTQLHSLKQLLCGYSLALRHHGIGE